MNDEPERGDAPAGDPVPTDEVRTAGTPLLRRDEDEPHGLDLRGAGDVVASDEVGMAELSSEYTADHALQDTDADAASTLEAWSEAAADSRDPDVLADR
jgi:hypothetical protein